MNFIDRLKEYMNANNLRQVDIIEMSGLSKSYISNVINGRRSPNEDLLKSLSEHSGKSINWWLTGSEDYNNLYSLNELTNFFISNGTIKDAYDIDEDTWEILCTMFRKEIKVKLNSRSNNNDK